MTIEMRCGYFFLKRFLIIPPHRCPEWMDGCSCDVFQVCFDALHPGCSGAGFLRYSGVASQQCFGDFHSWNDDLENLFLLI